MLYFLLGVEAFVIQHYIQQNVPKHLQDLQLSGDDVAKALGHMDNEGNYIT